MARAEEEGTPKWNASDVELMPLAATMNSCYYDYECSFRNLPTVVLYDVQQCSASRVCFITVPHSPLHNADALLDGYSVSAA